MSRAPKYLRLDSKDARKEATYILKMDLYENTFWEFLYMLQLLRDMEIPNTPGSNGGASNKIGSNNGRAAVADFYCPITFPSSLYIEQTSSSP